MTRNLISYSDSSGDELWQEGKRQSLSISSNEFSSSGDEEARYEEETEEDVIEVRRPSNDSSLVGQVSVGNGC